MPKITDREISIFPCTTNSLNYGFNFTLWN